MPIKERNGPYYFVALILSAAPSSPPHIHYHASPVRNPKTLKLHNINICSCPTWILIHPCLCILVLDLNYSNNFIDTLYQDPRFVDFTRYCCYNSHLLYVCHSFYLAVGIRSWFCIFWIFMQFFIWNLMVFDRPIRGLFKCSNFDWEKSVKFVE